MKEVAKSLNKNTLCDDEADRRQAADRSVVARACGASGETFPSAVPSAEAVRKARAALNGAKSRCHNPRDRSFHRYGGRGLRVADEWHGRGAARRLMAHIGPPPSSAHTLGRIDNDRGYEPGNVRWETWREQQNNRRSNVRLTVHGVTATLAQWASRTGISRQLVNRRLVDGWAPEVAAITPKGVLKGPAHAMAGVEPSGPSKRAANGL